MSVDVKHAQLNGFDVLLCLPYFNVHHGHNFTGVNNFHALQDVIEAVNTQWFRAPGCLVVIQTGYPLNDVVNGTVFSVGLTVLHERQQGVVDVLCTGLALGIHHPAVADTVDPGFTQVCSKEGHLINVVEGHSGKLQSRNDALVERRII